MWCKFGDEVTFPSESRGTKPVYSTLWGAKQTDETRHTKPVPIWRFGWNGARERESERERERERAMEGGREGEREKDSGFQGIPCERTRTSFYCYYHDPIVNSNDPNVQSNGKPLEQGIPCERTRRECCGGASVPSVLAQGGNIRHTGVAQYPKST